MPKIPRTLNVRFLSQQASASGRPNEVQVLYDGQVAVHNVNLKDRSFHLLSVQGKGRVVWTAAGLEVRVVYGTGKIAVSGPTAKKKGKAGRQIVLPGGSFTIDADPYCVVEAAVQGGIYASSNHENGILR